MSVHVVMKTELSTSDLTLVFDNYAYFKPLLVSAYLTRCLYDYKLKKT